MPELRFDHVDKIYPGGVQALRDFSLTVRDGECLAIMGASGCGKTTALRLVAGLEIPTKGLLYKDGQPLTHLPPWERGVAMAFQTPALLPQWSVRKQWAFSARQRQKRPSGAGWGALPDAASLARSLELTERLDALPGQLSGGEIQRVVLGKIILSGARVWLLDEPLAHLDFSLRQKFLSDLHLLRRQFPATILYVTHDPGEASAVGDRIAVLAKGVLQQVDVPIVLHRQPANDCVAKLFQRSLTS